MIHFVCVLKASRHLFGHHFLFLLLDELPPPGTVIEPFILLPPGRLGLPTSVRNTHIYKYTEFSFRSIIFLSHIVARLRLWEIHNGLASIYIYIGDAGIATDIFLSLCLFIMISAEQALPLLIVENDEWISDFDLLFLDPGGAHACVLNSKANGIL